MKVCLQITPPNLTFTKEEVSIHVKCPIYLSFRKREKRHDFHMHEEACMNIPQDIFESMINHCRSVYPDEACGILAGQDNAVNKIYVMTNTEPSPVSYFMDPGEQFKAMKDMRREGLQMLAIYHSHPSSPAYPSAKDVSLAFYPGSLYVIISLIDKDNPEIRAYEIVEGNVRTAEVEIPD